jgi:hypothetical protein
MKMMKFLILLFLLSFLSLSLSQIPRQMNYQGYLTDNAGNPVTGNHKLTFTIYDAQTGGNTLWIEEHPGVAITDGVFRVQLGSITALDLDFDIPYWLSIKVENDPELAPRIALSSVGYSFNSMKAESVADNSVTSAALQEGAVTLSKLQPDVMVKVFEGTCSGVSSYLITGLNGNLHKMYKIFFEGRIHSAEKYLLVRPNQDDVLNNYRGWLTHIGDAGGTNFIASGIFLNRSWVGECDVSSEFTLACETGRMRIGYGQGLMGYISGNNTLCINTWGRWHNTNDNITEIKFALTDGNGLASGTFSGRFIIYAVVPR